MTQQFLFWVIYPQNKKALIHKDIRILAMTWEQPSAFSERPDTEDAAHTYNGVSLRHTEEWNIAICDNADGSWQYYAK